MAHTIARIAYSIAFGPTSFSRESIKRYIKENERMVENERACARSPRRYDRLVQAGKLALELQDASYKDNIIILETAIK